VEYKIRDFAFFIVSGRLKKWPPMFSSSFKKFAHLYGAYFYVAGV